MVAQKVETVLNQQKRSTVAREKVTLAAAGDQLVPQNWNRTALVLPANVLGSYQLGLNRADGDGDGLSVVSTGPAVILTLLEHGALVFGPWYVTVLAAPGEYAYLETTNSAD